MGKISGGILGMLRREEKGYPLLKRIPQPFWAALTGALTFGIFAHGSGLFNKFSWHDDIFSLFMTGTAIELGRWMLYVFSELEKWFFGNGHFSLPLFNGLVSILCVGISAGLMVTHFRIRSRGLSALVGAVMAVFPVVTSLFSFMYTIHYYMVALVMMTGGGLLICAEKSRWKPIVGVLLCGCAAGVYQAFLPIFLMMMLLDVIMRLVRQDEKTGAYIRLILLRLAEIAAVMGVYFGGNEYFLWAKNLQLKDYLGISSMAGGSPEQYLAGAVTAYREFFFPSHFTLWDMYPQAVFNLYRLMLVLDAGLSCVLLVRLWKKNRVRALLLLAALALVPLGCNFIFVMSAEVHSLMTYGMVMQMVGLACLAEWTEFPSWPGCARLARRAAALLLALASFMYIRYDNQCYMKAAFQQQEAISWNTTLVTRIESAEGFRDELPVAFLNRENMEDQNLYTLEELQFLSLGTFEPDIRTYLNDWAWQAFLARWCGFEPRYAEETQVAAWPEVEQMPRYPDDGSIRVIHDTIVVKF